MGYEDSKELKRIVEEELDELVKEVLEKQDRIIPIIGDDCFVGQSNDNGELVSMPFQQWIVEELLGNNSSFETKKRIATQGYHGLDLLLEEYERVFPKKRSFLHYKNKLSSIIERGIEENRLGLRNDVKKFLIAGKFEVVVTTNPYNIIMNDLKSGNKDYSLSFFAPQRSNYRESRAEATLELPAVYQLFGNYKNDFVFGEGNLLRFLHFLNQTDTEKGYGASQLVKYIKDKGQDNKGLGLLMPIGCSNLPNWLFRFLWYPFCLDRLVGYDSDNQGGIWYKHSNDESFYSFLDKYNFRTFSESTNVLNGENVENDPVLSRLTAEFIAKEEKIKRYISLQPNIEVSNDGEWNVFISYAGEDFDFAKKVYDILTEECNQKVWMDKRGSGRINAGDNYWDVIQRGIEHSHKFLFIITENYLNKAKGKNHRDEMTGLIGPTGVYREIELIRHHILSKRKDAEKNNIIPVIVEGTKVTYTDINNKKHVDEPLRNGMLENLPVFEEYDLMQTQDLFKYVHDMVCNEETLRENLKQIFN